jgi:hypothetical protein
MPRVIVNVASSKNYKNSIGTTYATHTIYQLVNIMSILTFYTMCIQFLLYFLLSFSNMRLLVCI